MAAAVNFFKEKDPPHGLGKRLIYKKYLQAYIPIILSKRSMYHHVHIIDGFAGTGRYESYGWPTKIEKYGTPIIALHVAIRHLWDVKFTTDPPSAPQKCTDDLYLLKEPVAAKLKRKIANYKKELARYTKAPSKYEDKLAKCEEKLAKYEHELNHLKVVVFDVYEYLKEGIVRLIFIEPNKDNYKKLYENTIRVMLAYGLRVAVVQRFDEGYCSVACDLPGKDDYRIVCLILCAEFNQIGVPGPPSFTFIDPFGFSQAPLEKVKKFVGPGREVFINLMSSYINRFMSKHPDSVAGLFGLTVEDSMDLLSINDADDRIARVVNRYEHQLKTEAGAQFVINFEMLQRRNARLYHLVFATNHAMGLEKMKEAMNRATQAQEGNARRFSLSDYMIVKKGTRLSFTNDQDDKIVADFIKRRFQGQRVFISEVKSFILFETLFVYRKKPLSILEKSGQMIVVNGNRRAKRFTYPDGTEWELQFETEA